MEIINRQPDPLDKISVLFKVMILYIPLKSYVNLINSNKVYYEK